jgi:hypothetical protein
MTLDGGGEADNIAAVSLVGSEGEPDLRESLMDRLDQGRLIVNLRAEGDPELLRRVAEMILGESERAYGVTAKLEHMEHFRPSKPTPTHRVPVSA